MYLAGNVLFRARGSFCVESVFDNREIRQQGSPSNYDFHEQSCETNALETQRVYVTVTLRRCIYVPVARVNAIELHYASDHSNAFQHLSLSLIIFSVGAAFRQRKCREKS